MKGRRSSLGRSLAALRRHLSAFLLRSVHMLRRRAQADPEPEPPHHPALPSGPFAVTDQAGAGTILLFVPRNLQGRLIDEATGHYGYSHLAVDCGETDLDTGKRVLVEATQSDVHRSFQDEYGPRACVRLPLAPAGVDCRAFCACVLAKLGEAYDYEEALSRGVIDDPAKQICSDLATVCLPAELREDIARKAKEGALGRFSVSVHRHAGGRLEVFVSPNGFAEYLGAPPGSSVAAGAPCALPQGMDHRQACPQ